MDRIVIYGAGGLSKDIHFLLDVVNGVRPTYQILGYIDDNVPVGTQINNLEVLGGLKWLNEFKEDLKLVFSISKPSIIQELRNKISNPRISFPNLIHPNALVDRKYLKIGEGNVINYGCLFSRNVALGNFNTFNNGVAIGHDVNIGNFNHFGPFVQISGGVKMGDLNQWGLRSSIVQYKSVGSSNLIGAHSLLIKNAGSDTSYFGTPATASKF